MGVGVNANGLTGIVAVFVGVWLGTFFSIDPPNYKAHPDSLRGIRRSARIGRFREKIDKVCDCAGVGSHRRRLWWCYGDRWRRTSRVYRGPGVCSRAVGLWRRRGIFQFQLSLKANEDGERNDWYCTSGDYA